ncbi:glycyl-radical enzyme activating protein [Allocoprobacillus halotolerans]|uniref:glycyl-radical enzyme activating protein n=1 Tax=Allocoprobacillus halotolerans TaxID=2944914 RepID=UPI00338E857E
MAKGIIFNIQKFSIHDGPGIRTTVFLKGCPLRCQWCSNPESQNENIQILCNHQTCVHCLHCVQTCPQQAITDQDGHIHVDFKKCTSCLQCVQQCPSQSLSYEGEYQEVEEIVRICKQDLPFYEESQGGVTISGGEGMGQPQFVEALVHALKKKIFTLRLKQLVISQKILSNI